MAHSDDSGLVIPPRLAPTQAVIVPIFKTDTKAQVHEYASRIKADMPKEMRCILDDDEKSSPGWKFAEWEMVGVPVRVEIGPKDMEKGQAVLVRRDTGEKTTVPAREVPERVSTLLEDIQNSLFERARIFRDENTFELDDYEAMKQQLNGDGGFVIAPWDGEAETETKVKEDTKATIRVLQFGNEQQAAGRTCIVSGKPAKHMAIFSRAY